MANSRFWGSASAGPIRSPPSGDAHDGHRHEHRHHEPYGRPGKPATPEITND
jgi:hypothetical protein